MSMAPSSAVAAPAPPPQQRKTSSLASSLAHLRGRNRTRAEDASQNTAQTSLPQSTAVTTTIPTPSAKDTTINSSNASPLPSPMTGEDGGEDEPLFVRRRLSRAGSIYSLSRISFSSQISQLTAIQMPQASSLASSIAAMPSSTVAARALKEAADQLQQWTAKASDILSNLEADDDVEWAAAAGRDGLAEVDAAITRFEGLIQVYVGAVEDLQKRSDIYVVPPADMQHLVDQIEVIATQWQHVRDSLNTVKAQVELAMEWEELWNTVLGDIGSELDGLGSFVFEMEERRHRIGLSDEPHGIDIKELESVAGKATTSPLASPSETPTVHEDSNLLSLFARLQPLRASLEFLPMRLATFHTRASATFPTACDELQRRRRTLEEHFARLEGDADTLRRELGEDRWVLVFQNAGRQALKMMDSVVRSIAKLDEALDSNTALGHTASTVKKIESYEAKKLHYGPAIERVLAIVEKGVRERLTVNGEIMRLQADLRQKWQTLCADMRNMDAILAHFNSTHHSPGTSTKHPRHSDSTILSDHSHLSATTATATDTPGSSPASSTYLPSRHSSDERHLLMTPTPKIKLTSRRLSSLPIPSPGLRSSSTVRSASAVRGPASPLMAKGFSSPIAHTSTLPERPRWNGSTNTNGTSIIFGMSASPGTTSAQRSSSSTRPLSRISQTTTTPRSTTSTSTPPQSTSARYTTLSNSGGSNAALPLSTAAAGSTPSPLRRKISSNFTPTPTSTSTSTPNSNTSSATRKTGLWRPPSRLDLGPGPYAQTPRSARTATTSSSPAASTSGSAARSTPRRPPSLAPLVSRPRQSSSATKTRYAVNSGADGYDDGERKGAGEGEGEGNVDGQWTTSPPLSPLASHIAQSHFSGIGVVGGQRHRNLSSAASTAGSSVTGRS